MIRMVRNTITVLVRYQLIILIIKLEHIIELHYFSILIYQFLVIYLHLK